MKRRGFTTSGAQRWQCLECRASFTWKNPGKRRERERAWFLRWLHEGYSVRELAAMSGHGRWKIQRIIRCWLDRPPAVPTDLSCARRLIFDGTFLERSLGIIVAMDGERHEVIEGAYGVSEGSAVARRFLEGLKTRGLNPVSATIDGSPALYRHLRAVWPGILIQRCLVHVQRQGLMWCRAKPKRTDAKRLRELFLRVTGVRSLEERNAFLSEVRAWERRHGRALARTPERGWVVSDLIRARSMLLKALPDMFRYLDDPGVPKCTNALEGYFGRMKGLYRLHRGLAKHRRDVYFRWHFHVNSK